MLFAGYSTSYPGDLRTDDLKGLKAVLHPINGKGYPEERFSVFSIQYYLW